MHRDDTTERWLSITGFPGYEVSSNGRICSYRQGYARIMKPVFIKSTGYYVVGLRGTTKATRHIHRLVLDAFVGACPDGMQAAHLDGNPANNALYNLAWVTPKENQRHRRIHGTDPSGARNGRSKLTPEQVSEIRRLRKAGVMPTELGRRFGVSREHVYRLVEGRAWKE